MKRICILIVVLVAAASSCQKSQFSTTTRQYRNGRVTYVNNYHKERSKPSNIKSAKSHLKGTDNQNNSSVPAKIEMEYPVETEIISINSIQTSDNENLIASTSNDPTIITGNKSRFVPNKEQILSTNDYSKGIDIYEPADTINSKKSKKGKTKVPKGRNVIFFKSGNKEIVRTVSRSHDTLFYTSIKKSDVVRGITMEHIDTILWIPFGEQVIKYKNGKEESVNVIFQSHDTIFYTSFKKRNIIRAVETEQIDTIVNVKYYDSDKGSYVDIRKNEPLSMTGFIISGMSLVPIFALFSALPGYSLFVFVFASLALILGYRGRKKIKRNPLRYKGIKFARASIILGFLGLFILYIIFYILLDFVLYG